jgi:glutaredoxin-like protein
LTIGGFGLTIWEAADPPWRSMMPLLDDRVRKQVQSALATLERPVRVVMFTQGEGGALECQYCSETRELVQEVASLSDKVLVEVKDFQADEAAAKAYGIDKIPAIALGADGAAAFRIRFFGIPAGYEFSTLLEDLRMLGSGQHGLSDDTMAVVARLKGPVHIQVFVTPT